MLLSEIAARLGVPLHGDGSIEISGVSGIREARSGEITFLGSPKYEAYLSTTRASAIIMAGPRPDCAIPILETREPYLTFLAALKLFEHDRLGASPGIHPSAIVSERAILADGVSIGPFVVVEDDAAIEDGVAVMAGCYIGQKSRIGGGSLLYPHVVIRDGCVVGRNVIIHSGAVIGDDGFGFARDGDAITKVPQIGNVELGDDVEIGANTTIDRATVGTTRIGRGTRIDNLVQIAHNVQIGESCFICAQVGISGSTVVGSFVTLAGQAGLVGHIDIGDGVQVGAQGGVTKSIPKGTSVSGYPALPHQQAKRIYAAMRSLPDALKNLRDMARRLEIMERQLEELRKGGAHGV